MDQPKRDQAILVSGGVCLIMKSKFVRLSLLLNQVGYIRGGLTFICWRVKLPSYRGTTA